MNLCISGLVYLVWCGTWQCVCKKISYALEREWVWERGDNLSVDMNVNLSLKMATATVSSRQSVSGAFPVQERFWDFLLGSLKVKGQVAHGEGIGVVNTLFQSSDLCGDYGAKSFNVPTED